MNIKDVLLLTGRLLRSKINTKYLVLRSVSKPALSSINGVCAPPTETVDARRYKNPGRALRQDLYLRSKSALYIPVLGLEFRAIVEGIRNDTF